MKDIRLGDISTKGFYVGEEVYPYKKKFHVPLRNKPRYLNDPNNLNSILKEVYAGSFNDLIPSGTSMFSKLTK